MGQLQRLSCCRAQIRVWGHTKHPASADGTVIPLAMLLFHEPQLPIARPAQPIAEFLSFKFSLCILSQPASSWGWPWLSPCLSALCHSLIERQPLTCMGDRWSLPSPKGFLSSINKTIVFFSLNSYIFEIKSREKENWASDQ